MLSYLAFKTSARRSLDPTEELYKGSQSPPKDYGYRNLRGIMLLGAVLYCNLQGLVNLLGLKNIQLSGVILYSERALSSVSCGMARLFEVIL